MPRVSNHVAGLLLSTGASSNTVGGLTAVLRNVISGNLNRGVFISTPAGSSVPTTRKRNRRQLYRHRCLRTVADNGQHKRRNLDRPLAGQHHRRNGGRCAAAMCDEDTGGDTGIFIYGDWWPAADRTPPGRRQSHRRQHHRPGCRRRNGGGAGQCLRWHRDRFGPQHDHRRLGRRRARNIISNNTTNAGAAGILLVNYEQPGWAPTEPWCRATTSAPTSPAAAGRGGNYIGIDIEGRVVELLIDRPTGRTWAAADAAEGNLISGNPHPGNIDQCCFRRSSVDFGHDRRSSNNVVAGNRIGTNAGGTAARK